MPFAFNAVKLYVATINEKPWTHAREVHRALEYDKATKAADIVKHLSSREISTHKYQFNEFVSDLNLDWPRDSRKVFSSQQPKAKDFRRHCCNVLFPHVRQQLTNKIKEEHQQAIKGKYNQIQTHQQKILKFNEEIDDLIKNRHVAHRGCFYNVLCFIKKISKEAQPYYVNQCQYRQLEKYKKCLKLNYPRMEEAGRCADQNAVNR